MTWLWEANYVRDGVGQYEREQSRKWSFRDKRMKMENIEGDSIRFLEEEFQTLKNLYILPEYRYVDKKADKTVSDRSLVSTITLRV